MSGELVNTGHSLEWRKGISSAFHYAEVARDHSGERDSSGSMLSSGGVSSSASQTIGKGDWNSVNVSGGPLSYQYSLSIARLHYGERDLQGSEHTIGNHAFPAEVSSFNTMNCTGN